MQNSGDIVNLTLYHLRLVKSGIAIRPPLWIAGVGSHVEVKFDNVTCLHRYSW